MASMFAVLELRFFAFLGCGSDGTPLTCHSTASVTTARTPLRSDTTPRSSGFFRIGQRSLTDVIGSVWTVIFPDGSRTLPYPSLRELVYLVICVLAPYMAAMGFNRLADRNLDAKNPRTADVRKLAQLRSSPPLCTSLTKRDTQRRDSMM